MIGWYVHHQGSGHLTRARCIAPVLREVRGHAVVGLSSLPAPADTGAPGAAFADWVQLPADDAGTAPVDATAGGSLHWAPRRDPGVAARVAALTAWISACRPAAVVVDVSVEAAVVARLAGAPTIVVAMPGDRGDRAHQLAYSSADAVLAFWSREVYDPGWLRRHADRAVHVGAVSRYDGRAPSGQVADRTVVVLGGTGDGGSVDLTARVAEAAGATPGWQWQQLTAQHWVDDPWPVLSTAAVVVTHAGQNALAETAAARRPAVVVPSTRPFAEQRRTAAALARAGIVESLTHWPTARRWPELLEAAARRDPAAWSRWSTGHGARDAARVIAGVAGRGPAW